MAKQNEYGNSEAIVYTESGPIRGIVEKEYRSFMGIPYAAAPVGPLRWVLPQPVEPWMELRDATQRGNDCAQLTSELAGTVGGGSEDCLFLNVSVPRSTGSRQAKPVMVFVHGGALTGNGADCVPHRQAVMSDVIVVTINYRMGILGFFGYPGLPGSGSFGLEDQQAALRWVQRNIAAFGGDPNNVTLWGQSYGGFSTCAHLASPAAVGLFQRAIIQSAPCQISYPASGWFPGLPPIKSIWRSREEVEGIGAWAAGEHFGFTDPAIALEQLRAAPVFDLLQHANLFTTPAYGTELLPEVPATALSTGRFQRMPVLTGFTQDENRYFVAAFYELAGQPVTAESYAGLLKIAFGEDSKQVEQQYPLDHYASPGLAWATVLTDRVYAVPHFEQSRWFAEHVPTYVYEFADRQAPSLTFPFPETLPGGAYHASELAYQFDLGGEHAAFTPEQQILSDQMMQYWGNFTRTGDPNGADLPQWQPFHTTDVVPYAHVLAPGAGGLRGRDLATEHKVDFWSGVHEDMTSAI